MSFTNVQMQELAVGDVLANGRRTVRDSYGWSSAPYGARWVVVLDNGQQLLGTPKRLVMKLDNPEIDDTTDNEETL